MPETQEPEGVVAHACAFCHHPIAAVELDNPEAVYREVTSWVYGLKLQSPVLREQTGRLAHKTCIVKVLEGQAPDQDPIPGLEF